MDIGPIGEENFRRFDIPARRRHPQSELSPQRTRFTGTQQFHRIRFLPLARFRLAPVLTNSLVAETWPASTAAFRFDCDLGNLLRPQILRSTPRGLRAIND